LTRAPFTSAMPPPGLKMYWNHAAGLDDDHAVIEATVQQLLDRRRHQHAERAARQARPRTA